MSQPARLVPLSELPREAIVEYLVTFPDEKRDRNFWKARIAHWWDLNPAFAARPVQGWALVDGARVLGFWAAVPLRYQVGDAEMVSLAMSTWRVSPEARNQSLQLLFAFVKEADSTFAVNTTANEVVRKTLRAFRFQDEPTCFEDTTSYAGGSGALWGFRILAPILNLPLLFRTSTKTLEARTFESSDSPLVDAFWARTKKNAPVALRRDAEFYRWFCGADANQPKRTVLLLRDGEVVATLCFGQRNWSGRRELELLDIWPPPAADSAGEIAGATIRAARQLAREWRCDLLQFPHFSQAFATALKAGGLWIRRKHQRRHFFRGSGLGGRTLSYRTGLEGDWAI